MSLKDYFAQFGENCEPINTTHFQWTAKDIGYGGMYFFVGEDGLVHCDNENMSRQFLKDMLCMMVDNCVLDCPSSKDGDGTPAQDRTKVTHSEE